MFNNFFVSHYFSGAPRTQARIDLVCFVQRDETQLIKILKQACREAGGWSSDRYSQYYFSIPTGNLSGVDWYIELLDALGIEWFLKTRTVYLF